MRTPWIYLLLFLISGATGLIYELVWTRQLIFVFGGTTHAISTVLVAFMGGLGLGSYLVGRIGDRVQRPGIGYGVLEILIGLYALAVPVLLRFADPLYQALYRTAGEAPGWLTAARFLVGCLILLLPTTLMGATLPLLVRFLVQRGAGFGSSVAYLYGINSLGAVLGVLAAGFILLPRLGLHGATLVAAGANIAIGILALTVLRPPRLIDGENEHATTRAGLALDLPPGTRPAVMAVFAVSGFAAMVYQVSWTRALVMSIGSSTYSFTCILAAFILGLSLGSFVIARFVERWARPDRVIGWIQLAIALAAVLILPTYGRLPRMVFALLDQDAIDYSALLRIEFTLIIAVTFVPTFLLGMMFPLVTRTVVTGADDQAAATGRAYGVNTLGTIAGSFLAGFVFLTTLGVQQAILVASLLNGLSGAWLLLRAAGGRQRTAALAALAGLILFSVGSGVLDRWNPLEFAAASFQGHRQPETWAAEHELLYHDDDVDLTVIVGHGRGDPDALFLSVNGKTDASTSIDDMTTQLMLGHLPALLAPKIENACVIGLGSGVTAAALARHPEVQQIDCVEISGAVIEGAGYFSAFNDNVLKDEPRLRILRADGRNHLKLTEQRYDVIVSEPSNPWIAGVSNLFTREFFELCRSRLTDEGVVCIWLHGYSMSVEDFQLVIRTLDDVFPTVAVWELNRSDYGLFASVSSRGAALATMQARFDVPGVRADLYRVGLGRVQKIAGRYLTGGPPLTEWARGDLIHTDDNALLEFSAPRNLYERFDLQILQNLMAIRRPLVEALAIDPQDATQQRLIAQAERVRNSRVFRMQAQEQIAAGRFDDAVRLLARAYQDDPLSRGAFSDLRDLAASYRAAPAAFAAHPLATRTLENIGQTLPPIVADARGQTLPELVSDIRTLIPEMETSGNWLAARQYLAELDSIAPDDVDLTARFVRALVRLGHSDRAAARLQRSLRGTADLAAQLRAHPAIVEVATDPQIAAVLEPDAGDVEPADDEAP